MTRSIRNKSSLINTNKILNFVFNGKKYKGFEGDTLASALLANEVKLIARSFKYHRPRGIITIIIKENWCFSINSSQIIKL